MKNSFEKKGRPEKTTAPVSQEWHIEGSLVIDSEAVAEAQSRKGFFIVATNEMDERLISPAQLLEVDKAQNVSVERGFRFLKDPMFYVESLYLKLPQRMNSGCLFQEFSLREASAARLKSVRVLSGR